MNVFEDTKIQALKVNENYPMLLGEKFDNVCIFDLDSLCDLVEILIIRFVRF